MTKFFSQRGIFLIVAITAVIYSNSLWNGFVWDDCDLIVPNKAFHNFDLEKIFISNTGFFEYIPIRHLTYAIDAQLWGKNPAGYHLTNLLLYIAGIFTTYNMLRKITSLAGEKQGAFITFWSTLVFSLHPLHAEPVNFITARHNLLIGLFLPASFNLLVDGLEKKKNIFIVSSLVLFVLALFSKANAIFFPLFITAFFCLFPHITGTKLRKITVIIAFWLIDCLAVWIHMAAAYKTEIIGVIQFGTNSWLFVAAKAVQIPFFYLKMFIAPFSLTVEYPETYHLGNVLIRSIICFVIICILLYGAWIWRKRHILLTLGILWFFTSLIPVLNILPTHPVVADRYAYLAVLGTGLIFAYVLKILKNKSSIFIYLAVILVAIWGGKDYFRSMDWRSNLSLWEAAYSVEPQDKAAYNLAQTLFDMGKYEKAFVLLKKNQEETGGFYYDYFLGKYLLQAGEDRKSIGYFQSALNKGGDSQGKIHFDLAAAYEMSHQYREALDHYLKALRLKSNIYAPTGTINDKARIGAERVRAIFGPELEQLRIKASQSPASFEAQATLALFLQTLGLYEESEKFYKKCLEINPLSWQVWYNLGINYKNEGKYLKAIDAFKRSLIENPGNLEALNNIAHSYTRIKNYKKAEEYYQHALSIVPDYSYASFNLGRLYFLKGDRETSEKYFNLAVRSAPNKTEMASRIKPYLLQFR